MVKAWDYISSLKRKDVEVKLSWTPGHCKIDLNEIADSMAKKGCAKNSSDEKSKIRMSAGIRKVKERVKAEWQERWARCESGYATKEIILVTGTKIEWPAYRSHGVTVTRAILNNAAVANNMYRMKLNESPNCKCGEARETFSHRLMECKLCYLDRMILFHEIESVWES